MAAFIHIWSRRDLGIQTWGVDRIGAGKGRRSSHVISRGCVVPQEHVNDDAVPRQSVTGVD